MFINIIWHDNTTRITHTYRTVVSIYRWCFGCTYTFNKASELSYLEFCILVPYFYFQIKYGKHSTCYDAPIVPNDIHSTGNYSCLKVDLIFTRDRAFYFTTVFIPGIILVTSSFITFWLEWNAVPARSMIGKNVAGIWNALGLANCINFTLRRCGWGWWYNTLSVAGFAYYM